MATKKEWTEYFELTEGRKPTFEEFQAAMKNGEIEKESPPETSQVVVSSQEEHTEKLSPTFASSYQNAPSLSIAKNIGKNGVGMSLLVKIGGVVAALVVVIGAAMIFHQVTQTPAQKLYNQMVKSGWIYKSEQAEESKYGLSSVGFSSDFVKSEEKSPSGAQVWRSPYETGHAYITITYVGNGLYSWHMDFSGGGSGSAGDQAYASMMQAKSKIEVGNYKYDLNTMLKFISYLDADPNKDGNGSLDDIMKYVGP